MPALLGVDLNYFNNHRNMATFCMRWYLMVFPPHNDSLI